MSTTRAYNTIYTHSRITGAIPLTHTSRTLLTSSTGLQHAKDLITEYKQNQIPEMTPDLWTAKKIVDSTLHPGNTPTKPPPFLPLRPLN